MSSTNVIILCYKFLFCNWLWCWGPTISIINRPSVCFLKSCHNCFSSSVHPKARTAQTYFLPHVIYEMMVNIHGVISVQSRRNNVPGRLSFYLVFNLGWTYDCGICNSLGERGKKHLYHIISNKWLQRPRERDIVPSICARRVSGTRTVPREKTIWIKYIYIYLYLLEQAFSPCKS